jgi:hypothetical protein
MVTVIKGGFNSRNPNDINKVAGMVFRTPTTEEAIARKPSEEKTMVTDAPAPIEEKKDFVKTAREIISKPFEAKKKKK